MTDIKIAILDDHPIVVEGLKQLLSAQKDFRVVGSFSRGETALAFLAENEVDLILLDVSIPGENGMDLCQEIKKINPLIVVLMLSNRSERSIIMQSIQYGASGYLLKNASIELLIRSIREAFNGGIVFCEDVKAIISKSAASELEDFPKLTKREKEILKLVAEGKTSVLIARELSLSSLTVHTHRKNIMNKFRAKNVAELTKIVVQYGILC